MGTFDEKIGAQKRKENYGGDGHTIGQYIRAVMAIDDEETARAFHDGEVAHIQGQIAAGTWKSSHDAKSASLANLGWCFGEGMSPERIAMWKRATGAAHPVLPL